MASAGKVRVLDLRPTHDEALKPSQLIEALGHESFSLYARRALTVLWHNAHDQKIEPGKLYTIELSRLRTDGHTGAKALEEALQTLQTTLIIVKTPTGATRKVQFLGGTDLDDPSRRKGLLHYSFDPLLIELIKDSAAWGRLTIPTIMAFSSKYAISLYERAAQWVGLTYKTKFDFPLDEFRSMLGVEIGKYESFGGLNKHVIKPAIDEINALAEFNLSIIPIKESRRVATIRVAWWPKTEDELRAARIEGDRSKIGRRARISGKVEHVAPVQSISSTAKQIREDRRLDLLDED